MSDEDLREFMRGELERAMNSCRWYRKAWSAAHFTTGIGMIAVGAAATFISLYTTQFNWVVGLLSIATGCAASAQAFLRMEEKKNAFRDLNTGLQHLRRLLIHGKVPVEVIAERFQALTLEHNRALSGTMRGEVTDEPEATTGGPQAAAPPNTAAG